MGQIYDIPAGKFKANNGKEVVVASFESVMETSTITGIGVRVLLKGSKAIQKVLLHANITPCTPTSGGTPSTIQVKAVLVNSATDVAASPGPEAIPLGMITLKNESSPKYKENAWLCYWELLAA